MAYTTINKSTDYFNTTTYTGNGTARTITTDLTSTDFIWNKRRDSTGNHMLYDVVRGINKDINSDSNEAEETQVGTVTAFGSNSYTLGTHGGTNANGETRVSWNWSANGAGSSNTDGTITSTVSANTTAGFSIVKFTGTGANGTVGHGLGVKPAMIIQKNLSISSAWSVWHKSFSGSQVIYLNETGAVGTNTSSWNSTEPTSSVFSVGTGSYPNGSGNEQIYYVFADVTGYSKFGSYTGNGNADGTFVYTGFKPAFILIKRTDATEDWWLHDTKRRTFNPYNAQLYANASNAEVTETSEDILSNGFKFRTSNANWNASGGTFIYMAFGQSLVGSNNVPCTAR